MKSLVPLINELESKLQFIELKRETVSQATVGWHIEHALLAMIKMMNAVEHSNPSDYKWKFNVKRTAVLLLNKFPRGRAQAPAHVRPGEEINMATITPLLVKAKQKAELFETFSKDRFFHHFVFGDLKLKQAHRIIAIHTYHHIKIINEIISA